MTRALELALGMSARDAAVILLAAEAVLDDGPAPLIDADALEAARMVEGFDA